MAIQKFIAIIEIEDEAYNGDTGETEKWPGDKYDVACWIDSGMGQMSWHHAESTVWDNFNDFLSDHVLEALAEVKEEKRTPARKLKPTKEKAARKA